MYTDYSDMIDPSTGIKLTPSHHGEKCLGSGDYPGFECCCDECNHYLECFPDWDSADFQYQQHK